MPASGDPPPDLMPTRVLEISTPGRVRLKVCGSNEQGRYACLSYCWGKNSHRQLRTTKDTLIEHQKGIEWNQLPRTFQEALILTYKLGLRYLWIDSLCIVQDDLEDWRTEGGKMADIYAHSYMTFAATNSMDSKGGLCNPLPRGELCTVDTADGPFKVRILQEYNSSPYRSSMPLMQRAWFFQEQILAPRIVYFAQYELFWKNVNTTICECCELDKELPPLGDSNPHHLQNLNNYERMSWWHNTVEAYTKLRLTFEYDIFPALQGIAHITQQTRKCDYYAGLWADTFVQDMLWIAIRPGKRPSSNTYRAPTWSWASIVGTIAYMSSYSLSIHVTVLSKSTVPVGESELGQLKGGYATLRGPCTVFDITTCRRFPYMLDYLRCRYSLLHLDVRYKYNYNRILFMHTADCCVRASHTSMVFLLYRCIDEQKRIYERVGLWQVEDPDQGGLPDLLEMEITVV